MKDETLTVYSCSGCSNVAQLANRIAVQLDRHKLAKMSCIAGVGAGVPSLLKVAKSAEKILVLDGCPIACAKKCLENQSIAFDKHFILTEFEIKKIDGEDVNEKEFRRIYQQIICTLTDIS